MKDKIYLYPVWIRLWHLTNAIIILVLIFTGLSLQYSSSEFSIISFADAVTYHNICGIILAVIYILFLFGNHFSKNGMYYHIKLKGMPKRIIKQAKYYSFGIFKKKDVPFPISKKRKFNPLQKISYVGVMYFLVPIVILTGILLLFPEVLPSRVLGMGGIHLTDLIHIISGFFVSIFLIIHVYFCTIGSSPLSNFNSIITGWHTSH